MPEKKGICGLCNAGCWIVATYDKEGRIENVRPDEGTPMGRLCHIGERSPDIIYSPHRLTTPLKRTGPKGTYEFKPITWDKAYKTITEELTRIKAESGPEATAIYTGVGSFELSHCDVYQPKGVAVSSANSVLFPFGSPNTMGVGALCYVAYGMIAPHVTMGRMFMNTYSDIENSELIVVWGTNPATDLPPIDMERILKAKGDGAEVIVIDPRRTTTAELTDAQWVPIRPGTDGALALGMAHVLIEEELYDEKFVNDWTEGFDDFARYVQHFRPEVVEEITGVPAHTVVQTARRIAQARGVSQLMYTGMEYSNSGVQGIRATLALWAIAGQLDVPGGLCFTMDANHFPINRDGLVPNPDTGPRLGREKFPVYIKYRDEAHAIGLPDSVLRGNPYRIRSLIIMGGSLITSWPNPSLWRETLGALDFLVTIDRQFTADSAYADIVLPATTHYETTSYMTYGSIFRIREKMIEPLGDSRPDMQILGELADRLGYGHLYPQNSEQLLEYVLKGSGFTPADVRDAGGAVAIETEIMQYKKWEKGRLRQDGKPGFDTPSGKFEIASSVLEEYGYDPLPVYTEPKEGPRSRPDLAERFPLVFNSGFRANTGFHTQHHGVSKLSAQRPEPSVTLNAQDAAQRDIEDGDQVEIESPRGKVVMRARVTDDIVRGAIDANHAGGSPVGPKAWTEANVNALTDLDNYDPISGFPVYKCLLCEVRKLEGNAAKVAIGSGETGAERWSVHKVQQVERSIYLDNNATTPLDPSVHKKMQSIQEVLFGNPSSIHRRGREARIVIEDSRRKVAQSLGCTSRRVVFTGSGTEANNLAIKGIALERLGQKDHLITSAVEHPAVLRTCESLERLGIKTTILPVNEQGVVLVDQLSQALTDHTCLVSIMLANNETGAIQPIAEISKICSERGVPLHVDAVQAFGKIPVNVDTLGVHMLTISAHKLYGPKGVGALYVRKGIRLKSLLSGGDQEHGLRASTENIVGIAGLGSSVERLPALLEQSERLINLRDHLEAGIAKLKPTYRLNGPRDHRLPNTLNVTLPGIRGESVVLEMDKRGIQFSSGSACKSGSPAPSHALMAMGMGEEAAHCALRFSLGCNTTETQIVETLAQLGDVLEQSKNIVRFISCK